MDLFEGVLISEIYAVGFFWSLKNGLENKDPFAVVRMLVRVIKYKLSMMLSIIKFRLVVKGTHEGSIFDGKIQITWANSSNEETRQWYSFIHFTTRTINRFMIIILFLYVSSSSQIWEQSLPRSFNKRFLNIFIHTRRILHRSIYIWRPQPHQSSAFLTHIL